MVGQKKVDYYFTEGIFVIDKHCCHFLIQRLRFRQTKVKTELSSHPKKPDRKIFRFLLKHNTLKIWGTISEKS